jgi:hypothetical protein
MLTTPALGLTPWLAHSRSIISAMSWMVRNSISRTTRQNHQLTVSQGGKSFGGIRHPQRCSVM